MSQIKPCTIGEVCCQMIHAYSPNDTSSIDLYLSKQGVIYPNIVVPTTTTTTIEEEMTEEEEEEPATLFEQMAYFLPPLQAIVSCKTRAIHRMQQMEHNDLKNARVRAFDWHSSQFSFAIARQDSSIHFYRMREQSWSKQVLRHDFQANVRVVRYKTYPEGSSTLLVGCHNGILLWQLDQTLINPKINVSSLLEKKKENVTTTTTTSTAAVNGSSDVEGVDEENRGVCMFLQTNEPVTSLEWFPRQQQQNKRSKNARFVSASPNDHRVAVWEFDEGEQEWSHWYLTRFNGGIRSLSFSPNGRYLAVFTYTGVFRVWETETWTSEKWSSFEMPVQASCWSADSRFLLISTHGDHKVHILGFNKPRPKIEGEYLYEINFKNHPDFFNIEEEKLAIESLALDHAGGQRLVVSFAGVSQLAVLMCDFQSPRFESSLLPVSFKSIIYAPPRASKARHLQFWPNFKKGSLLACSWDNGKISFIPFYYSTSDDINW